MKHFLLIAIFMISLSTSAQSNFNFSEKQADIWELAKKSTLDVARAMPEEFYNYKPTKEVKSFGQQMAHIANSMLSMDTRFILKERYYGKEKDASSMQKSEIIQDLETAFNTVIKTMKSQSDKELQTAGKTGGRIPLTKWQSYLFMQDHITNHRAKSVLYLRLKGIDPPQYGYN